MSKSLFAQPLYWVGGIWRSGNAFHPITEITPRQAELVLGSVTAAGR